MVTSSELCTIVTTKDNSFLVWGSRPVIKTPLGEILEQGEEDSVKSPRLQKCGSNDAMDNTVFTDDPNCGPVTPNRKHSTKVPCTTHPSGPLSPNSDSRNTSGSQPPSSGEGSPTKASSNDSIAKGSLKSVVSEAVAFKASPRMISNRSRNPSLNFSEIPHSLVPCPDCHQYLKTLSDILFEPPLDISRGKTHPLKRDSTSGTHLGTSHNRRGVTMSGSNVLLTGKEGIIMQPTSMDLVGKSGILDLLSMEHIREAKLEGLSCYGSNVIVLIQAQVEIGTRTEEEGGAEKKWVGHSNELTTFRIGRKLTHRTHWRLVNSIVALFPVFPPLQPKCKRQILQKAFYFSVFVEL